MGCENSKEKNLPKKENRKQSIIAKLSKEQTTPHYQIKSWLYQEPNKIDDTFEFTIKSFQIMEKLADHFTYKRFRVISTHNNIPRIMYIISIKYHINVDTLNKMKSLHQKNLLNILYVFTDENYVYIITDYAMLNLFDAVFSFTSFSIDKFKRMLTNLLASFKYLFDNNMTISYFDYSKIWIVNEYGDSKFEYFDIDYLIEDKLEEGNDKGKGANTNTNTNEQEKCGWILEDLWFKVCKICCVVFFSCDNTESTLINFNEYDELTKPELIGIIRDNKDNFNPNIYNFLKALLKSNSSIDDVMQEHFLQQHQSNSMIIKTNTSFYRFYSKYYLNKTTFTFLNYGLYYHHNEEYYKTLFDSFERNSENNELKIVELATNIRSKMKHKYSAYEIIQIISLFSNMKVNYYHCEQFIQILKLYDSYQAKKDLKKAFELFVSNYANKVQIEEWKGIFGIERNKNNTNEDVWKIWDDVWKEFDKDEKSALSYNEFVYILMRLY